MTLGAVYQGAVIGRDWKWKEVWPAYCSAMKIATKWMCKNGDHYIDIVNVLYALEDRPSDPRTFAEGRVANGLCAREILTLLVDTGLAE